jgi:Cytochrome P460
MLGILAGGPGPGAEMQRVTRTVQRRVYREIRSRKTLDAMFSTTKPILMLLALTLVGASVPKDANAPSSEGPEYTSDGQLKLPGHYRNWIFLTSDFHPVSNPAAMQKGGHATFFNIFASPEAYDAFLQTGTWPDKTMFVVEVRGADDVNSNSQKASVQSSVLGLAVHVKDETRFSGKWAFFGFHGDKTSKMTPLTADCYSCHAAHGAVDSTFVQFYPTLLPIAKTKDTLSAGYKQEMESAAPAAK